MLGCHDWKQCETEADLVHSSQVDGIFYDTTPEDEREIFYYH